MSKSGARRFILGIEGITALVTGASALVAFTAALVLGLVISDARSTIEASALSRAEYLALELGSRPSQILLESLAASGVPGGGVSAVKVVKDGETVAAYPPVSREQFENSNAVAVSGSQGVTVFMIMEMPQVLRQGSRAVLLMAVLGAFLTLVAVLVPSYLRRRVLDPLRGILGQADRIEEGGGKSAETAGDSFRRLIDMLRKKDLQLKKLREEALERAEMAESRSGAVLESMGSAVVVLGRDNEPTLWNSRADEVFSPTESTDGFSVLYRELEPFRAHGLKEWDGELNGRNYRYRITESGSGESIVLATDVTASLALERRLAEESALADLGALSGGVAHEIGNALCALEGFVQLLGRGSASSRTASILKEAETELETARKIVESFRKLSQNSSIESFMLCSDAFRTAETICGEYGIARISMDDTRGDLMIPGSPVILARILTNLLSNSLRYCSPAGISVHTGCEKNHMFVLSVLDSGPGLPMDTEAVFRPMYTTEANRGGMGLGLTLTRRLVRAMGGTIRASNREGTGAHFRVSIPCMED